MLYKLGSAATSRAGSVRAEFFQSDDEPVSGFPLVVMIEGFFRKENFAGQLSATEDFEIEFENNRVSVINGEPLSQMMNLRKEFIIALMYERNEHSVVYSRIDLSDDVLDAETIEL
jgi:hypothetical protein